VTPAAYVAAAFGVAAAAAAAQASTSAASVVESMVRILRMLRVFRIFRLGKRLQNEIQMRVLTLIFTLLAIIVTSAGLFYEVSRLSHSKRIR
jgi:uncharacterized membrane protein